MTTRYNRAVAGEEKEKNVVYTIIESFISKKKFKDFVQQNVAL